MGPIFPVLRRSIDLPALGASYLLCLFLLDRVGWWLELRPGEALWNPYSGLSLALLVLGGLRLLPLLAIRPWMSFVWVYNLPGVTHADRFVFAGISMAVLAAAAFALRHAAPLRARGADLKGMVAFALVALAASAAEVGLILAYAARALSLPSAFAGFFPFWLAECLGILTLTPLLWLLRRAADQSAAVPSPGGHLPVRLRATRWAEYFLHAASVPACLALAFASPLADRKPAFYMCFLPTVWIALKRGLAGAAVTLLALNAGALLFARAGSLPPDILNDLRVFLIVLTAAGLFLGARTSESGAARRGVEAQARLVDVVRRIQERFIEARTLPRELFQELLNHLLDLSGSRYDFICERDEESPDRYRVVAEIGWDLPRRALFHATPGGGGDDLLSLRRLFAEHVSGGRPILVNGPEELARFGIEDRPLVRSLLVLPLAHDGEVVGLLGIADRPGGVDADLVDYLAPVTGASAGMIAAWRQKRRRERAERDLHASEERFRRLVEDVRDYAIFTLDAEGRVASWNRGAERIKGYAAEEILGRDYSVFFSEEDRRAGEPRRILAEARGAGRYRGQGWRRRRDGSLFLAEVVLTASRDKEGRLLGYSKVTRDVTERLAWEARARDLGERLWERAGELEALLDVLPVGIALMDAGKGRITGWNPAFARLLGLAGDPLAGAGDLRARLPAGLVIREDGRAIGPEEGPLAEAVFRGRPVLDRQLEITLPGGETRVVLASAVPLAGPQGRAHGGIGVFLDVTDHVRTRKALARTEEQLQQSQKLEEVGRIAGGVAHDFNNLLTAINGYADLALAMAGEASPLHPHLSEIRKAGDRAASLTRQLLVFSRRQEQALERLPVNAMVEGMEGLIRRVIPENIRIQVALDPGAGEVLADRNQAERVLLNLVVNARDAMPGGGTLTLETRRAAFAPGDPAPGEIPPGRYAVLSVIDTGVGMDAEVQARLFEPFFTTKRESGGETHGGTGLGLAMSREILQRMGGGIACESAPGRGARFEVFLPVADAAPPGSPEGAPPAAPAARAGQEKTAAAATILVVDDEEPVRNLVRLVLEGRGYRVIEVPDGEGALAACADPGVRPDLLITDVVMPGMGGRELAGRLKALWPDLPIIFISGYTGEQAIRQGYLEPWADLLPKPFAPRDLVERVRAALGEEAPVAAGGDAAA